MVKGAALTEACEVACDAASPSPPAARNVEGDYRFDIGTAAEAFVTPTPLPMGRC